MSYYKIFSLLLAIALCALVDAQDSLRVKEFPVLQIFGETKHDAFSRNANDSIDQELFFDENLAQRLVRKGIANVQLYGAPGSIASSRINGAGANHTSVNWNGIPINSPSLGQTDFSLIPMALFESAELVGNNSQALSVGCNIGGSVLLSNQTRNWQECAEVKVKSSVNSLFNFSNLIKLSYTHKRFTLKSAWIQEDMKNVFSYTDTYSFDKPRVIQNHNDSRVQGFVQSASVLFPKTKSELTAVLWWQKRHSELPAIMGKLSPSYQSLLDSSLRATLIWSGEWRKSKWKLQAAHISESERYTDKANAVTVDYLVDSKYSNHQWFIGGDWKRKLGKASLVNFGVQYFNVIALNSSYQNGKAHQEYSSPFVLIKTSFRGHELEFSARQEIRNQGKTLPAYGLHYSKIRMVSENWKCIAAAEVQHKFRYPTMNELFWVPGGNSSLRPEDGWSFSANPSTEWWRKNKVFISLSTEALFSRVNNWIQWIPSGSIWMPQNYKIVQMKGAKAHLELNIYGRKARWTNALDYSFSQALGVNQSVWDKHKAFIMPYVPLHSMSFSTMYKRGRIVVGSTYRLLAKRYTLEENSEKKALPMLALVDVQTAWSIPIKSAELSVVARVENLCNVSYQMVRSYAMPGRVISLSLQCTFKSKTQNTNEEN